MQPNLLNSIRRLVSLAAEAGMSVQQMIDLLNAGLSVEGLLLLIELRVEKPKSKLQASNSPPWLM